MVSPFFRRMRWICASWRMMAELSAPSGEMSNVFCNCAVSGEGFHSV